ncbi:MAG TPA: GNAT family N-acetyltransferase [Pseudonocardiaceae bacterium]|jgi:predicted GNAT family acetyltransferase
MHAALHAELAEFVELTRPLLGLDPVRHSVALTVLNLLSRVPEVTAGPPVLLTVHEATDLLGVALCTPPRGLIVSGLPASCTATAAEALAPGHPGLPEVSGPRVEAEAFAQAWSAQTGAPVHERMALRVYALHVLTPPVSVPGAERLAGTGDLELLARWREEFATEATGGLRGYGSAWQQAQGSLAAGTAALLWEVGGQPVSWASASAPSAGMSRIGPVYTPAEHRGHGYGSAVTAAAVRWALGSGVQHVVLFADLANPVTNAIYPRIGFRPVHDAVEIAFTH